MPPRRPVLGCFYEVHRGEITGKAKLVLAHSSGTVLHGLGACGVKIPDGVDKRFPSPELIDLGDYYVVAENTQRRERCRIVRNKYGLAVAVWIPFGTTVEKFQGFLAVMRESELFAAHLWYPLQEEIVR